MMMASGDFRLRAACSGPWSHWGIYTGWLSSSFQAGTGYEPYQEQYIYKGKECLTRTLQKIDRATWASSPVTPQGATLRLTWQFLSTAERRRLAQFIFQIYHWFYDSSFSFSVSIPAWQEKERGLGQDQAMISIGTTSSCVTVCRC